MARKSIAVFLQLIRYKNLSILLLTQLLVFFCLFAADVDATLFVLLFATATAFAAGNIINDMKDVKADNINKADKVLIGVSVSAQQSYKCYVGLVMCSITAGFFLPLSAMILVLFCNLFLYLYSAYLKGLPLVGNVCVALLAASSIYLFWEVYEQNYIGVLVFSCFTFVIHLIREIIKDLEDVEGDKASAYRTFPIVVGQKFTKVIVVFVEGSFVFVLLWLSLKLTTSLFLYNLCVSVPVLIVIIFKTIRADSKKTFSRLSQWCKVLMLLGLAGMFFA